MMIDGIFSQQIWAAAHFTSKIFFHIILG